MKRLRKKLVGLPGVISGAWVGFEIMQASGEGGGGGGGDGGRESQGEREREKERERERELL